MPEYDFFATLQSDLEQLRKELDESGVDERINQLAQHLGVPREVALAALWRSSKRHGQTIGVFLHELAGQTEREIARQSDETDTSPSRPGGPAV